jgi:hypothetical protein
VLCSLLLLPLLRVSEDRRTAASHQKGREGKGGREEEGGRRVDEGHRQSSLARLHTKRPLVSDTGVADGALGRRSGGKAERR